MGVRDEIMEIRENLKEIREQGFALEILKDYKKTNKRMFIVLMTVIFMWVATIAGFIYYICNYDHEETTETYTTELDTGGNGVIDIGGDVNNG